MLTHGRLFGYGLVAAIFLAVWLVLYVWVSSDSVRYDEFFYWAGLIPVTISLSRKLGGISFLEAVIVALVWLLLIVVLSAVLLGPLLGFSTTFGLQQLVGMLLVPLTVLAVFRRKHSQD